MVDKMRDAILGVVFWLTLLVSGLRDDEDTDSDFD